ncbi:adenylate/guanylate cyclase domain-containing protein [Desulfosarcina sp.]|uniref:adenylate/guanylate cyclase domain-containing protein n=1 Tax=Desulfosarcina sp. TaxID=2027861 RepID=UPI0035683BD4
MLSHLQKGTWRRCRLFAWVVGVGISIGIAYGSLIGFAGWGQALEGGLIGAVHGLVISGCIGLVEIFVLRTRPGQRIEQAPLVVTVLIKGVLYGAVITAVELSNLGELVVSGKVDDPMTTRAFTPISLAFSFGFTFIIIFILQISRLIGSGTLKNLVAGRYHRPRMEDRFFLFVDLVGSTPIAETIGPLGIHRFLNRVFTLFADPVADHDGEIYQYVGDQIVITWLDAAGRQEARPLACFFAIRSALADAAKAFEERFGVAPAVRGALHAGPVVAGEVGVHRRSIVFHGDVMNVCARLEQATRDMGCSFLASNDAIRRLEGKSSYSIRDRGSHTLRGRQSPMQVFEVSTRPSAATGSDANM